MRPATFRSRRWRLASTIFAVVILAACGGASTGSQSGGAEPASGSVGHLDLILWHTQSAPNSDTLNEVVQRFNSSHPAVTVKLEYTGNYDDEYRKLLVAAKGGGLPDMAVAYENVVSDLMKGGVIVPLDAYVGGQDGLSQASLDDVFPGYLETNRFKQFNNQLLSFPFTKSQVMAYYNVDLLNAAGVGQIPETWDQFGLALRKVQEYAPSKGLPFNGAYALNVEASNIDFSIMSRGGKLMADDQAKVAFNNDQAVQAMQFDADLAKANAAYIFKGSADWQNDFAAQKTAAALNSSTSSAFVVPIIEKAPKQFKWVTAAPPYSGQKATVMYGANVAIFKSTPAKQAAAWQFIKWFTDTDQTAYWSVKTHYLPVRKSAANSPDFKKELGENQGLKASFDYLQYARPEPNVAGWQAIREILTNAETAVVTGKMSPKQALSDAEVRANKALEDAR